MAPTNQILLDMWFVTNAIQDYIYSSNHFGGEQQLINSSANDKYHFLNNKSLHIGRNNQRSALPDYWYFRLGIPIQRASDAEYVSVALCLREIMPLFAFFVRNICLKEWKHLLKSYKASKLQLRKGGWLNTRHHNVPNRTGNIWHDFLVTHKSYMPKSMS